MQHSTKKPFAEQLLFSTNAESENTNKQNSSDRPEESESTFEQIPFTPFFLVGDSSRGYAAVMGKFRITEIMTNKEDVVEYVNAQPYELLIAIMSGVFESLLEMKAKDITQSIMPNNPVLEALKKDGNETINQ